MGIGSFFRIVGSDNGVLEYREHISVVSTYTYKDFENTLILEKLPDEVKERHDLKIEYCDDCMVNLCTPSDRFHPHVDNDSNGWTMIYYMNMSWHSEWGGDTVFLTEDAKEIEFVSMYKPGRMVLFDPKIPHIIRPSTTLAPYFRLTLATKFIPYDHTEPYDYKS